jgi:hypothetical protein
VDDTTAEAGAVTPTILVAAAYSRSKVDVWRMPRLE